MALTDGNLIRVQDLRFDPHAHSPSQPIEEDQEIIQDVSGDRALLHCLRQNGFDMKATAKAVGWERSNRYATAQRSMLPSPNRQRIESNQSRSSACPQRADRHATCRTETEYLL